MRCRSWCCDQHFLFFKVYILT
uniref:Uncharacterized protein n=1 Tax=Rhizophora mucronata TaxID=61149 RepID=A0A2P2PWK7_RHIMU